MVQSLPFYISIVCVVLLVVFYGTSRDDFQEKEEAYIIFGVLSALQIALTGLSMYLFFLREAPLWVENNMNGKTLREVLTHAMGKQKKNRAGTGNSSASIPSNLKQSTKIYPEKDRRPAPTIHDLPPHEQPPSFQETSSQDSRISRLPSLLWSKAWFVMLFFAAAVVGAQFNPLFCRLYQSHCMRKFN